MAHLLADDGNLDIVMKYLDLYRLRQLILIKIATGPRGPASVLADHLVEIGQIPNEDFFQQASDAYDAYDPKDTRTTILLNFLLPTEAQLLMSYKKNR